MECLDQDQGLSTLTCLQIPGYHSLVSLQGPVLDLVDLRGGCQGQVNKEVHQLDLLDTFPCLLVQVVCQPWALECLLEVKACPQEDLACLEWDLVKVQI